MRHLKSVMALAAVVNFAILAGAADATPIRSGTSTGQIPDGVLDADNSGSSSSGIQVSGAFQITPLGITWTMEASEPVAAGSWVATCDTTSQYFPTVTGNVPNDDVIASAATVSVMTPKKMSFQCAYKTIAHAINIVKKVTANSGYALSVNGTLTTGNLSEICIRATKKTVNFTCH
jgi:hypothetical protein